MKTLEQVYGKVKASNLTPSYPTRVMQVKSSDGDFELIWKLKYDHWFFCSITTKGWHHVFSQRNNEVQTEAAFRRWGHHSKATFRCEPDSHPPFRNLISPIHRTTISAPRSDAERSLNRVHAQARPL